MTEYVIREERPDYHVWYTEIPNSIDGMGLSLCGFRLYAHLKRVAGEDGKCWKSTTTLAKDCNMSSGAISKAKNELKERGLIRIMKLPHPGRYRHEIVIIDVWEENFKAFQKYKNQRSPSELQHSPDELQRSPGEIKKNPIRKTKEEDSADSEPPVTARHPAIKAFRSAAHRYPAKSWYQDVADCVGEKETDLAFWSSVVKDWVGCGWNPTNVKGMLDCYKSRRLPGNNSRPSGKTPSIDQTAAAAKRVLEMAGET